MENDTKRSRFGELALELMGAEAGRKFVEEVWNSAPPERKTDLAAGVMAEIQTQLKKEGDAWRLGSLVRSEIDTRVKAAVRDLVNDRAGDIEAAVMSALTPEVFEKIFDTACDEVKVQIRAQIRQRFNLRDY